jgi:hypothetical protein
MKEFYYQIKGKKGKDNDGYSFGNWSWPPIFSGKVNAIDRKEAQELINELYGKHFPLRVLKKDLNDNEFLLNLEEIKEGSHYLRLFEKQVCLYCGKDFYIIDKYNDQNIQNKGSQYCSDKCKDEHYQTRQYQINEAQILSGTSLPVIYKITNKQSNKCYIGKTIQVFTLRWYQHFFQGSDNKFHAEIRNTPLTDWVFEIQELVRLPEGTKSLAECEKYIIERERYWIAFYDSINNGYNSI